MVKGRPNSTDNLRIDLAFGISIAFSAASGSKADIKYCRRRSSTHDAVLPGSRGAVQFLPPSAGEEGMWAWRWHFVAGASPALCPPASIRLVVTLWPQESLSDAHI